MTRKGMIAEILSKALHHDRPDLYLVGYLDFDTVKETTLLEFLKISENFQVIPATRIAYIKKGTEILYSRQTTKKDHDMI
ncbi:MAG TPA: DUF504 domain-containing protein [Candidatus Nitrosotalea sp.]|nr:DUF504 domain-containing protein [Nitrososphaerota archaeon]HKU32839.1 DUF504 domain-containing protein [Candidatus Nitrosotalea sp.]